MELDTTSSEADIAAVRARMLLATVTLATTASATPSKVTAPSASGNRHGAVAPTAHPLPTGRPT